MKPSTYYILGAVCMVVGLFVLWPLFIVGIVLVVLGYRESKKVPRYMPYQYPQQYPYGFRYPQPVSPPAPPPSFQQPSYPYPVVCPNCGQQLSGYQAFCPRCGYDLRAYVAGRVG